MLAYIKCIQGHFACRKCSVNVGYIDGTTRVDRDSVLFHNQNSWRVLTVSLFPPQFKLHYNKVKSHTELIHSLLKESHHLLDRQ